MNFGIGYDLFSGYLQSLSFYHVCMAAYAILLACPFVFWKFSRHSSVFAVCMGTSFVTVLFLSVYLGKLNPDEGQHLLMAYSAIKGGVPFRDFEGQGLGPLNAYYLALFSFCGISFVTARIAALFAELTSCVLIFLAVKKLCGARPAITLSSAVFFFFSIYWLGESISYNSETLFTLLISLWFMLFAYRGDSMRVLFAECFVLGLLPWAKLQFAPFSVICFFISLARGVFISDRKEGFDCLAVGQKQNAGGERALYADSVRHMLSVTALAGIAGFMPTVIFLTFLALNGGIEWFWTFYIIGNIEHVSVTLKDYFSNIWNYLLKETDQDMFWLGTSGAVLFIFLAASDISHVSLSSVSRFASLFLPKLCLRRLLTDYRKATGTALLMLFILTALFSFTRTMSHFGHYIIILVPSSAIFVGLGMTMISEKGKCSQWAFALLMASSLIFGAKLTTSNHIRWVQDVAFFREDTYPFRDALHYLNEHVKPGMPVAYWGWETAFAVYSDHPSATATNFIYPLISSNFTHRMREKYVQDIIDNKPAAIIDFVCPAAFVFNKKKYELANYGFIRRVADEYYEKPVSIPAGGNGYVRIYLRKKGL